MIFIFPDPGQKWYITTTHYITTKNGNNNITGIYISEIH